MTRHVELTEMPRNYTGGFDKLEVLPFSVDCHDRSGMYVQHVSGCGYKVWEVTPDQAEKLAFILLNAAKQVRKDFEQPWTQEQRVALEKVLDTFTISI
jgi:hypothetical protein